jgi:hypothetical protein
MSGTGGDVGGDAGGAGGGTPDAAATSDAGRTDAGGTAGAGGGAGTGMTPPMGEALCPGACANQAKVGCAGFDQPGCEATCRDSFTTCAACNTELSALHACSASVPPLTYYCEGPQPVLQPTGCLAEASALVNCRLLACPGT